MRAERSRRPVTKASDPMRVSQTSLILETSIVLLFVIDLIILGMGIKRG